MDKINFVNNNSPYLSANNLNQLQNNVENAFKNEYSESTTDGYSADYINNIFTNLTINEVQAGTAHDSHSGGYYRIGNLVIVNVTVKGNATGPKYILTGFPKPAQDVVSCSCVSASNGTLSYSSMSANGSLEVNIANASLTYRIMSVYITNE